MEYQLKQTIIRLTLIRGFLELSLSVISGKKSIIITGDVTDETRLDVPAALPTIVAIKDDYGRISLYFLNISEY